MQNKDHHNTKHDIKVNRFLRKPNIMSISFYKGYLQGHSRPPQLPQTLLPPHPLLIFPP